MRWLGLRSRILLALLVTSAITLGAAALALFSPLQDRLEDQQRDSVQATALATKPAIEAALIKDQATPAYGGATYTVLETLSRRTDARVALYDGIPSPDPVLQIGITDNDLTDVYKVLATSRTQSSETRDGAGIVTPLNLEGDQFTKRLAKATSENRYWVLAIRKPANESEAVGTVRSAFLAAALVGLGVALVLGIAISAGLSRRLGRLRRVALRLAAQGPDAAAPVDDGRDEVGDLARALASMQHALRRQEEARRRFVSTASHELRTPLTSLQGNLELLAEDLDAGSVDLGLAREQLRSSQGQLRRLASLASELLDLSRLDAGVALRREPVELGELCRAVAAEFELRAHDRAVDIAFLPPPGPVWASGDANAVAQVVRILLDNALRFSPAGEQVRLTAAYHGEQATVEVADHGPGVPDEERELVFERFQRGSRTGGEGGFGLGLAIGRELAERLGGHLDLLPRLPGAEPPGAHLRLSLPIELPRGEHSEKHQQPRVREAHPQA